MIGAAAGIASGNLDSVGKNAIAGAYSGSAIGTGMANYGINKVESGIAQNKIAHEEALKEMYGDNYSDYIKQRKDDLFKRDSSMREMYSREFSKELEGFNRKDRNKKLDNIMNAANEYRKHGVTDNGTIVKAMKMDINSEEAARMTDEEKFAAWTDKEKIAAAKLSGVAKSGKDLETTMKRLDKNTGISKEQKETIERRIRKINDIY